MLQLDSYYHSISRITSIVETWEALIRDHGVKSPCQVFIPLFRSIIGMHLIHRFNVLSSNKCRNVGLFRYWTLSNIPLFLLATPMTVIMILSGIWALKQTPSGIPKSNKGQKLMKYDTSEPERLQVLRNLAFSQLVLTMLTLTTAHVQIITRISSAYPVWMWCLAMSQKGALLGSSIGFIVMYTIIQAGLFASFLPPA